MKFIKYTNEAIPRFGTEDPAGAFSAIVNTSQNSYNASYGSYGLNLGENAALFRIGDIVTLNGVGTNPISGKPVAVMEISGNKVIVSDFQPTYSRSGNSISSHDMVNILNRANPDFWTGMITLARSVTSRAPGNVKVALRNEITYHYEVPEMEERFTPVDGTGLEVDIINTTTTPNIGTWKEMIANREEVIATDPELEDVYTLYKKTVKYTRCR